MIERETSIYKEGERTESPVYFLESIQHEAAEKLESKEKEEVFNNLKNIFLNSNRYAEATFAVSRVAKQNVFRESALGEIQRIQRVHQIEHQAHTVLCEQIKILNRVCAKHGLNTKWYEIFLDPEGKVDRNKAGAFGIEVYQDSNRIFEVEAA